MLTNYTNCPVWHAVIKSLTQPNTSQITNFDTNPTRGSTQPMFSSGVDENLAGVKGFKMAEHL